MKELIRRRIGESIKTKESLCGPVLADIEKAAKAVIQSLAKGGKLLIFGNGGSASDSQHIAAELVGRFRKERRPLGAIALTANTSALTAIANDYGYEAAFSRQVEALGAPHDIALAISTSGNSRNVIEAVKKAKSIGMKTIALTGCGGGRLRGACDIAIVVDSRDTPRIQESHILIGHILCELVEEGMRA